MIFKILVFVSFFIPLLPAQTKNEIKNNFLDKVIINVKERNLNEFNSKIGHVLAVPKITDDSEIRFKNDFIISKCNNCGNTVQNDSDKLENK